MKQKKEKMGNIRKKIPSEFSLTICLKPRFINDKKYINVIGGKSK
jgi:hypothetical protein